MTTIAISDISTIVNAEPRVLDVKLGAVLGMAQPLNIRKNIDANRAELAGFGSIHEQREMIEAGKGARRSVTAYYLNEPQALLLCMFARTERAAEVRKQIIEVFMAWRRQQEPTTAMAVVPVKAHTRRINRKTTMPADEAVQHIRAMRRSSMYTVEQIAAIHGVDECLVREVSDDCVIDRPDAAVDVQKVGLIDDALTSLRNLYEEMGRRLADAEAAFHHGAANQHRIGNWS